MTTPVTLQSLASICVDNASKSFFFPTKIAWIRQAQNLVEQSSREARPTFSGVLREYKETVDLLAQAFRMYSEAKMAESAKDHNPTGAKKATR